MTLLLTSNHQTIIHYYCVPISPTTSNLSSLSNLNLSKCNYLPNNYQNCSYCTHINMSLILNIYYSIISNTSI